VLENASRMKITAGIKSKVGNALQLLPAELEKLQALADIRGESFEQTAAAVIRAALPAKIKPRGGGDSSSKEALMLQALWSFTDREMAKLNRVAELRHEELIPAFRHTVSNLLGRIPATMADRNIVRDLDFESVEFEGGMTRIKLTNGRVFYGYPSRLKYINVFYTFKDLIPQGFMPETYAAGVDAIARYRRGADYPFFPGPGGVVIEGGAYVGYKAIRFGEVVGPTGRVIAIEIGRANYDMLCRNIHANGMEKFITPVHCGIWKERGEMTAQFEIYASHALAPPEEHDFYTRQETVPTDTLDNIIDAHDLERVDFINLQTNGSEIEAIEGIQRRFNDVKIIRAGAFYKREGVHQADAIAELFERRGCKLLQFTRNLGVTAVTPKFVHEYAHVKSLDWRSM
jgi:FkbM family methyltransferase